MEEGTKQEILLESGTNEMEIIEFYVGAQPLGINVQKLKEIISFDESALTVIPDTDPAMLGVLMMRGSTIPLLDLKTHLKQRCLEPTETSQRPVVMVCEFNHRINGFKVDGVNQIHRIRWSDVQPLAEFIDQYRPRFTGSVNIDGREILILDLEYIIGEFDPDSVLTLEKEGEFSHVTDRALIQRQSKKILMAEDSNVIRSNLANVLRERGFSQLEVFIDGEACYARVLELKHQAEEEGHDISQHLSLVVSDIEMPKMDGLTLCRRIKETLGYKHIPVVLFSSLINPPMEVKCDSVGADGYASKPELPKLVRIMDEYLGIEG
ncbi:two-component system, chemotaxis family, response regulator CheV [Malonomonas rubra DSM 5091]|uniref:Two-component system, chemotaxis family, response regulator CheV n=1 Tax=Malonomonas rubra DSM 5091 TaxID=1122189 RepID=A0A1M6KIR6_MALRU|nr:chemotaxis protein [Malonomonas rubra]SHJ58780.1 two-component system, chemotaxis family, response regulator CheV [Malonomonas rubra DSM 5091]